ncbi:MAG: sensor-containing diguanylate cyclase/phosphodiesterase [Ilumatobacteraceae bacterium]|nr:sensor-containing diguanylate cyclase/phosphodiesterase [Ilumatobacteraceae bacterium]
MSVPAQAFHRGVDPRAALDALPDLVFVLSPDGDLLDINEAGTRLLGWQRPQWLGRSVFDVVHPDDLAMAISSLAALQDKEIGTPVEVRVRDTEGDWHWMEVIGANHLLDGGVSGLICAARDITQRRMWEVAGGDAARLQQIVQHSPSITMLLDADGLVASVNVAFTRLLGHDPSKVVGMPLASFVEARSLPHLQRALEQLRAADRRASVELSMRTTHGEARPIRFELADLLDDPVVHGIIASGSDISELRLVRQELEFIARHDPLTGLANRSLLIQWLDEILAAAPKVAVLFIDLDRFKPINDLYGHDVGDAVLRQVAKRLLEAVRVGDMVARVGGDEFVALAVDVDDWSDARELADRIESSLGLPYLLDVGPVKIGASVGVSLADPSSTVSTLLAAADVQMYHAKRERRGGSQPTSIDRRRVATDRRDLAIELASGLDLGEVVAHLQPVLDLQSGAIVGMEALARWNHPRRGLLRPSSFIDLVDDAGLDTLLGDAVLVSACAALSEAKALGFDLELGINLSLGQLTTNGLCAHIRDIITAYGIPMSRLVVEITERATLLRHVPRGCPTPEETLDELHHAGVSLSLDDFGTGHSSLNHVRRFPLSSIKVDRAFVTAMALRREDHAVVEVVVGLARALGLSVVAEGVETAAQLEMLRALGCDRAQGYLLGEPMPAAAVGRWLRDRRRFGDAAATLG